jgi:hypothetical protein
VLVIAVACAAADASSGKATAGADPEPAPKTVTVVGDSLTVLGDGRLRDALSAGGWWVALDAYPGRTTGGQMATLRGAADRANDATVIELGTNDALAIAHGELSVAQADADIVAALDLFRDRCVVWVIPDRDPERRGVGAGAMVDDIVTREASRRPNLHVADQGAMLAAHPEYLVGDRVHLTGEGYSALGDLMTAALAACT